MRRRTCYEKVLPDEHGGALPIFGFALAIVLAVGCFTIDLSSAYLIKGRLQNAADAAALSAALDVDKDSSFVKTSAAAVALANAASADGEITKRGCRAWLL
jgi:Flp pilus assembly protein TadG